MQSTELSITPNSASGLYLASFFRHVCAPLAVKNRRKSPSQGIARWKSSQEGQARDLSPGSSQIFLVLFPSTQLLLCIEVLGGFSENETWKPPLGHRKGKLLERAEGRTSLVVPHSVSAASAPPDAKSPLNPIISGIKSSISVKVVQRGSNSFTVHQHSPFPV